MNNFNVHIPTLRQIRHGEVVLFSNKKDSASDRILLNFLRLAGVRFTPKVITVDTHDLNNLIAVRRPVLTHPDMDAFVIARLDDRTSSHDIVDIANFFTSKLSDITDEHPKEIELINLARPDLDTERPIGNSMPSCSKSLSSPKQETSGFEFHRDVVHKFISEDSDIDDALSDFDDDACTAVEEYEAIPPFKEETEVEVDEEFELDADRKAWLDSLTSLVLDYVSKYHSMPPMEKIQTIIAGKLSLSQSGISPVTVNREMRIILPDYNEMELRMTPLARTIYILFLCHPEGIALKNIGDYRNELENIYLLVKPGASESNARKSIDELTIPGGDSLRQKLSMVKRAVNRHILNSSLAKNYYIEGLRGEPYKINGITEDMIHLPAVLLRG